MGFRFFKWSALITVADSISVQVEAGRCIIGNDMNYERIRMVDDLQQTQQESESCETLKGLIK